MGNAVHRDVEHQAATRPSGLAIVERARRLTYRELNVRANALARVLAQRGLTRGSLAMVRMPLCTDLAIVLLAVLKAGACYTWIEPGSPDDIDLAASFCIVRGSSSEQPTYLAIDIERALDETASRTSPNLPILTRGSDIACVLRDQHGRPHILVPHSTIGALPHTAALRLLRWDSSAGAFDMWLGLRAGATLMVVAEPAVAAA